MLPATFYSLRLDSTMQQIERDLNRFRKIVRGHIKKNLRKYMSQGEMIGRQGKKMVSIPLPQIDIPQFRHGGKQGGGVGQGEGEVGDAIAQGDPQQGTGEAGSDPGQHVLEAEMTFAELAELLGEELELPRIEPKGNENVKSVRTKYSRVRRVGPDSLRHFKRTYKEALRRQVSVGDYDHNNPTIIPIKDDMRYRSWKDEILPENNAIIIYMMDVSGSMGTEQKQMVRMTTFWIETWLKSQYKTVDICYIVHDAVAKEVEREIFYRLREGGGTKISSAYQLCTEIVAERYPVSEWNIYPFHFSDGDNWGNGDTEACVKLLKEEILPQSNQFCYGQVKSAYGSGNFIKDLQNHFSSEELMVLCEINNRDKIYDAIKTFLGKGR